MNSPSYRPLQILAPALTETDPVCGMAVDPETALSVERDGVRWWFCNPRCRDQFEHPERFPVQLLPSDAGYVCSMCPEVHSPDPAACPRCGMALEPAGIATGDHAAPDPLGRRLLFAVLATVPVFLLAMGPMVGLPVWRWVTADQSAWLQAILATAIVLLAGGSYWRIGLTSFVTRQLNMFSLLVIGVGAALIASWFALLAPAEWLGAAFHAGHRPLYFESAAVITTLVLLGQWLEAGARRQTTAALTDLASLAPRVAHVQRQGHVLDLPLSVIRVGDQVEIRPGEQVPLDGVVLEGESTLDESLLTGESNPVNKTTGDAVVGGAINQTGRLAVRVTHAATQTVLAQIVRLVAEAQRSRAPIQRLADQAAAWFVPVVLGVAALTAMLWLWLGPEPRWVWALSCAVSVLIIACPCALGLATPMAITTGVGRGAKAGILFRNASSLEVLAGVDTLFVDKTGTLTEGRPQVSVTHPAEGVALAELLFWAASVEQASEHPWARALVAAARSRGIKLAPVEEFRSVTGFGVEGRVHGHLVRVGRPDWNEQELNPFADQGGTPLQVVATLDGQILGGFAFGDLLRPAAKSTITRLKTLGLDCVMLTGDRIAVAEQAARTLGLTHFQAELSPAQKHLFITTVQRRHRVAMAGDGINDAPALAAADVGIALGSGTDIAQQAAGVVLLSSDLRGLPRSVQLSRAVRATIQQNLLFAFLYNALGIPLAAGLFYPLTGWLLDPMLAAAAMSLSSVSVVVNSLRLRWLSLD